MDLTQGININELNINPNMDLDVLVTRMNELQGKNSLSHKELNNLWGRILMKLFSDFKPVDMTKFKPMFGLRFFKSKGRRLEDGSSDENHLAGFDLIYMGLELSAGTIRNGENGIYIAWHQYMDNAKNWQMVIRWREKSEAVKSHIINRFKAWAEKEGINISGMQESKRAEIIEEDIPF